MWKSVITSALVIWLAGCGEEKTARAVDDQQLPQKVVDANKLLPSLIANRAVVVPGMTNTTSWLPAVGRLELDYRTGTLFAQNRQGPGVVEFDTLGQFLRGFGTRTGSGPGEVLSVVDFSFSDSLVVLLDPRNVKTLVYSRNGDFLLDFRNRGAYRELTLLGDRIYYIPGSDGAAFDVSSLTGVEQSSVGQFINLPAADSPGTPPSCLGCSLLSLGDSLLVVVNRERVRISTFTPAGEIATDYDLINEDPLLSGWDEHDQVVAARMRRESSAPGGMQQEFVKSYFMNVSDVGDGTLGIAVIPSSEEFQKRGYEYWAFNVSDGSYHRFGYGDAAIGFVATGLETVYALRLKDEGIYRLDSGAHSTRR